MARSLNKVMVIGNLGRDPEIRYPASSEGRAFGSLSVATTDSWFSREKNQEESRTEWHRVRVFAGLAEVAEKYLRKGDRVYIEGRLETRSYEKDGQTRYVTEIVARDMLMLGGRDGRDGRDGGDGGDRDRMGGGESSKGGSAGPAAGGAAPAKEPVAAGNQQEGDNFEDDLPF